MGSKKHSNKNKNNNKNIINIHIGDKSKKRKNKRKSSSKSSNSQPNIINISNNIPSMPPIQHQPIYHPPPQYYSMPIHTPNHTQVHTPVQQTVQQPMFEDQMNTSTVTSQDEDLHIFENILNSSKTALNSIKQEYPTTPAFQSPSLIHENSPHYISVKKHKHHDKHKPSPLHSPSHIKETEDNVKSPPMSNASSLFHDIENNSTIPSSILAQQSNLTDSYLLDSSDKYRNDMNHEPIANIINEKPKHSFDHSSTFLPHNLANDITQEHNIMNAENAGQVMNVIDKQKQIKKYPKSPKGKKYNTIDQILDKQEMELNQSTLYPNFETSYDGATSVNTAMNKFLGPDAEKKPDYKLSNSPNKDYYLYYQFLYKRLRKELGNKTTPKFEDIKGKKLVDLSKQYPNVYVSRDEWLQKKKVVI